MRRRHPRTPWRERLVHAVESQQWVDRPSYKLEHLVALAYNSLGDRSKTAQDTLHGRWLGHPLHSVLTDVAVGAWTASTVLDATSARGSDAGADRATRTVVGVGLVGGVGAALSGLTDWQYTHDNARRTGLAHGALNTTALGLYALSWRERGAGNRGRAVAASTLGYGIVLASAYLGGTLVYRHSIGVDHAEDSLEPRDFRPVCPLDSLVEGVPRRVDHGDGAVVLVRSEGRVHGLGAQCAHLGAPMGEGWLQRGQIVCPWHGSRYDLATGRTTRGPATAPLPCYETRVRDGQVEVRRVPEAPGAVPGRTLTAGGDR